MARPLHYSEIKVTDGYMFSNILRRLTPRKVITAIRFLHVFNRKHGHGNSRQGLCLNGEGEPIPWITYPCLEFISELDFSDSVVFEFGSGSSTLWWSKRSKYVYSVEREAYWYEKIKAELPSNAHLTLCKNETLYPKTILEGDRKYDVVIIDGAVRFPCAEAMISTLHSSSLVILDNSEWYPNLSLLLRDRGFFQIDFCGFAPINAFPSCTSIFFRDATRISRRKVRYGWTPIGGHFLVPYDDKTLDEIDQNSLRFS